MIKCSLCGVEFKNGAGLAGHKRLVHPGGVHVDGHKVEEHLDLIDKALNVLTASIIVHQEIHHGLLMEESRLKRFPPGVLVALENMRKQSTEGST